MAFIQARTSRGKKYWSIVESRRIDGKPRPVILEYLGTADTLLKRLQKFPDLKIKTYSHGDSAALVNIAVELDIVDIINKHVPVGKNNKKPKRDNLTVGASLLLGAIGRACRPTSKLGWHEWAKTTSLEYNLKSSFKKLDSQHFWDQMDALPADKIPFIEEEIINNLIKKYKIKLDSLLYDTSNFFTFIDSANAHCDLPQRGKNKQKRYDLRQIGLALLVSKKDQFPLFHRTYKGNSVDVTIFKDVFSSLVERIKKISKELTDITIVFDKGNNSKNNFAMIDSEEDFHYVGGLVSSYHKDLIREANENFSPIKIEDEEVPAYRIKKDVWGKERTCIVTISKQLKEGQIRGINQHLEKKSKILEEFKQQLESPKKRKKFDKSQIKERLGKTIKGQFIDEILKYELIELGSGDFSFTYFIDQDAFQRLKDEILGRRILVTNRHDWKNEEIILAYRGQSKVEYAFRNVKNPYHCAIRPQYHWTDQKIEVHVFICIVGYLLTVAAYSKIRKQIEYKKNMSNFMEDLKQIRLARQIKNAKEVNYRLEQLPEDLRALAQTLSITDKNLRSNLKISVYT
jgi:transposase